MNDSARGGVGRSGGAGRAIHPGSGRRKAAPFPRGRVLRQDEVAAVKALLGERPRERALLIEYLHLIQDQEGCLPEGHLQALAEELRIPMAEVYEVATFYAHFDVVARRRAAPASSDGARLRQPELHAGRRRAAARRPCRPRSMPGVRVLRAPCIGSCHTAPAAEVGHHHVDHATPRQGARDRRDAARCTPHMPAYQDFDAYVKAGGYAVLRSCLSGARKVDDVIAALSDGGLRGLGGAGFPTGRKWSLVRAEKGPRLMAVNGDEGEPGTFKDRIYLESEPHKFLEGMLIAAWAVEADAGLHLHARRVPGRAEDPRGRDRQARSRRPRQAHQDPRAPRRRRLHLRRRERHDRVDRGQARAAHGIGRPTWRRSACSAGRRSSTTSRRSTGCRRSWRRARRGSPHRARTAPRACAPTRCRGA